MSSWRRAVWLGLAASATLLAPTGLMGQAQSDENPGCSIVELPGEHWAPRAVRRLEAAGISDGHRAARSVDLCAASRVFLSVADGASPRLARLAQSWSDRLRQEYPSSHQVAGVTADQAMAAGAGRVREGVAAPGRGEFPPERTGAQILEDRQDLWFAAGASLSVGDRFASAAALAVGGGVEVSRLEAAADVGPLRLIAGRGASGFGIVRGGSLIVDRVERFDRVEIKSEEAWRLPLGLGDVALLGVFSRLGGDRHEKEPYFAAGRLSVRPHERFRVAINRGAMFGGSGVDVTPERLLHMLIGRVAGEGFEDQIVSVDAEWRLPTEGVLPLALYMEWGAEDASGSWWKVPGRTFGMEVPFLPVHSGTGLAIEYTEFAQSCCFNPEWYRHYSFPGGWSVGDEVLGHPLGGHGTEVAALLESSLPGISVEGTAEIRLRDRGEENLFVPGRAGRSVLARAGIGWRIRPHLNIDFDGTLEQASDWSERRAALSASIYF